MERIQTGGKFIKFIRIFLLVLIIIGVGLLITEKIWVPKLVASILSNENPTALVTPGGVTSSDASLPPPIDPATGDYGDDINGQHIGAITSISSQNTSSHLTINYVQWIQPCPDSDTNCTDGYEVVDNNSKLRTFPISDNVQVVLQTYNSDFTLGLVSLQTFIGLFNDPTSTQIYMPSRLLYWVTLTNGVVTRITEQYQP